MNLHRIKFNEFKIDTDIDDNLKKLVFMVIENDELYFYISDNANDEYFYFLKNHYLNRTYLHKDKSMTLRALLDNGSLNDIYDFLDTKNFFKMNKGFLYHIKDSLEYLKNIDQFIQIQTNTGNFQVDIFGFENTTSPITNININKKYDIEFHKFIKSYYNKYKKLDWYKNENIIIPTTRYNSKSEKLLEFNAIKGNVLDANNIYRGFISARDLVENIIICENDKGFQRNIYQEHVEEIKKFLDSNDYKYKYFSEITIAIYQEPTTNDIEIENIEENFYKIRININNIFKQYDCNETITSYKEIWQKRKYYIIDGRHRLSAIKEFLKDKGFTDFMLSINIIVINRVDEFDPLAYFYYINQKQRALIPEDYINLINTFEENKDFIYDWNVIDIVLFNLLKENFKKLSWIKSFNDNILSINLLKLIDYMKKNKYFREVFFKNSEEINNIIEKLVYYLDIIISNKNMKFLPQEQNNDSNLTLKEFLELIDDTIDNQGNRGNSNNLFYKLKENNLEDKFYVLIYLILYYTNKLLSITYNDIKKDCSCQFNSLDEYINAFQSIQMEFKDYIRNETLSKIDFFLEYKDISQHLENPESIIKIIENLYMEKSRIIFYSSKFKKEYERNYYIVKDVISDIEKELGIKIYFLRLDKPNEILPTRSFDIHNSIINMIKKSGLLIADISGNSANVYHEIGIKMGLDASENKNPNLIIIKDAEKKFDIPFNIDNLQYIDFPSDIYLQTYLKEKLYNYFVPKKPYFS